MAHEWADEVLTEFFSTRISTSDPVLDAVQTAILLEDVFGVTVTDADINAERLGTPAAARGTFDRLLGRG